MLLQSDIISEDQKENILGKISMNHHQRYLQSKNNLSFSKKLNSALSKSTSLNYNRTTKDAGVDDCVAPLHSSFSNGTNFSKMKRGSVKSDVLPPIVRVAGMDNDVTMMNHLEIIESACKAKGLSSSSVATRGESIQSNGSGLADFVNPLQYLMPLDDYNDCTSPSVDDGKQTSNNKRKGSKQHSENKLATKQLSRHQSFSKSWPRLDEGGPQTLPQIPSNRNRSMDASKASSGSISTDIAKFNKSRAFRLRSKQKSSEKLLKPNKNRKPLQRSSTVPPDDHSSAVDEAAIAKVAATNKRARNNTATTTNAAANKKKSQQLPQHNNNINKTSNTDHQEKSSGDSLASAEDDQQQLDIYEESLLDEIDIKCIKWLQDVTRERTQNPDKIFLPHLLMP